MRMSANEEKPPPEWGLYQMLYVQNALVRVDVGFLPQFDGSP